jgi:LysR family transcriptional regulator, glycine cleavage system transcriptional activator
MMKLPRVRPPEAKIARQKAQSRSAIPRRSSSKLFPDHSPPRLPLTSLRVFTAVAQQLNLTWAADALGVTTGAVSRQVRVLEEYLGRPLFQRSPRGLSLTETGTELLPKVQAALGALEGAVHEARAERGSGSLRVTMLATFLQQWLLARLPRFRERHPGLTLQLHTSRTAVDFNRSGHHIGLRFGTQTNWPGLHAQQLMREWLVPVCTPPLLKRFGPVDDPKRLQRYSLLHCRTEPWALWSEVAAPRRAQSVVTEFDVANTVIVSAVRGEGLALARWSLVGDEVKAGTLAIAASAPRLFPRSYWFVCPRRALSLPAVGAFKQWIFSEAALFPPPPGADNAVPIRDPIPECGAS